MKTSQQLKAHLKKKNPCDKVCPVCNRKLPNQRAFNTHRKTHEVVEDEIPVEEIEPVNVVREPVTLKALNANLTVETHEELDGPVAELMKGLLFALDDFDVEQIIATREQITASKDKIVYEKYSYARTTIRGPDIEKLLKPISLMLSLGVLDHKANIPFIMQQLMYNVHTQRSQPYFHSLVHTDLSRDIIGMYTRQHPDAEGNWIKLPFLKSLSSLNRHARKLTLFVIQAGMNALEAQYWKPKACVVLRMCDETNEMILFRANNKLIHQRVEIKRLGDFTSCYAEHTDEINALVKLVNEQKGKALAVVNNHSLSVEEWKQFFSFTRSIGIHNTIKSH